ncbi:MAG: type II secretion system F family protein [Planctomycetota bacterium]
MSELPLSTRIMIALSSSLRHYQASIPLSALAIILLCVFAWRARVAVANFHQSIFYVPIFGLMFRQVTLLKICRTLGDLLSSGVSIIEALTLTRNMTGNNKMGEALEQMRQAVENGERMSETCRKSGAFPESMIWKLTMAEERGIIEDSLEELAGYYERELTNTCSRIVQIIQPLLLVFLALMVGVIVVSLYLPLFQLIG